MPGYQETSLPSIWTTSSHRVSGFKGRIAHGLLGLILLDGLKNRAEQQFAAVASLSWHVELSAPDLCR
jgi:hypothetical protein